MSTPKGSALIVALVSLIMVAYAGPAAGAEVTLMTHDSFRVSKSVVAAFEKTHQAKIRFLKAGDAGAALNQALLAKDAPLADVFFGVDNTLMSRALKAGLFQPYASPMLKDIADGLKLDDRQRLLPVDYGDVCLNYDRKWFAQKKLAPPLSLDDLVKPEYAGLLVVENPALSSPGLAFLLTTVSTYGKDGYIAYWKKLKANKVLLADGWENAFYGHFTAASDGDRPIVVSYASSPPAMVHFSEKPLSESPIAAVTAPGTAFRQIEFVGILSGAGQRALAEKLVDFMLGRPFQEDLPLQNFVFPANKTAVLPDVFVKHARVAQQPANISPAEITANREAWIEAWTNAVLR